MKNRNQIVGVGSLLASTFIYSFFGVLTRLIGFQLPLFYASWVRNLAMLAILAIPLFLAKKWIKPTSRDLRWIFLRSIGGIMSFVGSYISFFYLPLGLALFIFYAGSTIGGYFIGKIMFDEKFTKVKILSFFIAIFGLILIYSINFSGASILYASLALLGGFGVSVWNTFSKKVSHSYSALQLNFLDTFNFILIEFFISLALREKWVKPEFSMLWFYMFLFVLMFILTGQLMVYGYKHLNVHIATLIMLTEVLFGVILGFIFYKETLSVLTMLGGLLIIFAIVLPEVHWKGGHRRSVSTKK